MKTTDQLEILHISDLHISTKDTFDQDTVLGALLDRIVADRQKDLQPEIVVVTGDIAKTGIKEEYTLAQTFFKKLLAALELSPERLFIVPGNHDVNRKAYRPKDIPVYENMTELNRELEDPGYRADLLKGMDTYFAFIESEFPHLKPLDSRLVPFVTSYAARSGKTISMVGLNSAWMCRKSPDEREIAIGEYQLVRALEESGKQGETDFSLYLFHHPLAWLWETDRRICRKLLDRNIVLCGHQHDAAGGYFHDLDGSLFQFQAGAAYLGVESEWPNRYQHITIDWRANSIHLNFRKFDKTKREWVMDGATGDDGTKTIPFFDTQKLKSPIVKPTLILEWPEAYCQWVTSNYGHMDTEMLQGRGQVITARLPEIFIPLFALDPKKVDTPDSEKVKSEAGQDPVELEVLISRNPSLLVEGHPGSGKTTLLKHIAYCLAEQKPTECRLDGSCDLLPVLILLKDLDPIFDGPKVDTKTGFSAELCLDWYFRQKIASIFDLETVTSFLQSHRVLLMLDGLDEVRLNRRNKIVHAFADLMIKFPGNKIVLTGRPHGISEVPRTRFGSSHAKILALTTDQVREFIRKWFTHLYQSSAGLGAKNAQAMIGEINAHPTIGKLIDNPLMLTAVCILYQDDKELPGQRAELYKKFIDNMLYRRFDEPERVHQFLKHLAYEMHSQRKRSIDRNFAIRILTALNARRKEGKDQGLKNRMDQLFDDIESRCGLLKFENSQYSFWHLTFQEFLTADYISDNSSDHIAAIHSYWGKEWWEESLELYIGYLSIEHMRTANDIIAMALKSADGANFARWRLAARSLLDIHQSRRDSQVVDQAGNRLLEIIDRGAQPKALADAGETLGWLGDPRNLAIFVSIEGGEYDLEELGKHTVEPFEIAKYPVTNSWFGEFIKAGGYEAESLWSPQGQKWLREKKPRQPAFWDERRWKCPNAPVVGVCWYETDAFCRWLTAEQKDGHTYFLPSEVQWQAAAAGKDKREYPWGKEITPDHCNYSDTKLEKTSAAGIFKIGQTPEEMADLAGNVWEWTTSDYHRKQQMKDFEYDASIEKLLEGEKGVDAYLKALEDKKRQLPVLRGGSWINTARDCRSAVRDDGDPSDRYHFIGFRCARI
ncbi:hypothetical protein D1BOALGB6SA_8499 [Olavius sp. associated proteobacterium Delta 1]|nr:hypothetical protein D1BOALGB6SA_8499 [Olavius sp. associated proteobacterium Delta 1]